MPKISWSVREDAQIISGGNRHLMATSFVTTLLILQTLRCRRIRDGWTIDLIPRYLPWLGMVPNGLEQQISLANNRIAEVEAEKAVSLGQTL
jgi:hypothetical protein